MPRFITLSLLGLSFLLARSAFASCHPQGTIEERLDCLSGVVYKELTLADDPKIPAGYRRFEVLIEQPVDHFNPLRGIFYQRLALLHKNVAEPMILQTSGYKIFSVALSMLAKAFEANQIQIEHRFFDQSTPADMDWSKLNIVQSAYDFHRITQTFRKVYAAKWVNTGASKGGMTSTYHRRYFPDDLDGTVADVAPLSFAQEDYRYVPFVEQAGGKAYEACRQKLKDVQVALLKRRNELMPLISGNFLYLGGKSVAYEHAAIELSYAFWQYQNPTDSKVGCDHVPAPDSRAREMLDWVMAVNPVTDYGDENVFSFMPYYYQAATQLGGPAAGLSHLNAYRKHPYSLLQYTPKVGIHYTNQRMRDVLSWATNQASQIIFVYGEFDPWSAGAYPRKSRGKDYHWYQVPGGNHSSKIFKLPAKERDEALAIVGNWLGKAPKVPTSRRSEPSLDEIELSALRHSRLP